MASQSTITGILHHATAYKVPSLHETRTLLHSSNPGIANSGYLANALSAAVWTFAGGGVIFGDELLAGMTQYC
jgi:hypothetical protein